MQSQGHTGQPSDPAPKESFRELIGQLATDSAGLVREEFALALHEVRDSARAIATRLAMILAAAFIGIVAMAALSAAAVVGLADSMGYVTASLVVGAILTVLAAVLLFAGIRRLRKTSLKPERTIETLQEGKRWMKELT